MARADGVFDAAERAAFERVVTSACAGAVTPRQIEALVKDLDDLVTEDGVDSRVKALARPVHKPDHAHEVLRIAALLADTSDGISEVERATLEKIAFACHLEAKDVDTAIADVRAALAKG